MHNTSLVVFANFRIDNKERYLRLKDFFFSQNISAEKLDFQVEMNKIFL